VGSKISVILNHLPLKKGLNDLKRKYILLNHNSRSKVIQMMNFDITYLYIPISIIVAIVYLLIDKAPRTTHRVIEVFLLSFLVISIGFSSLIGFISHVFFADQTAALIGWAAGSPFQREIGFANLAIGVLGITCIWLRGNYWVATVVATTIFLWGAAYGHIVDIMVNGNYAPGNAGGVLYNDILVPLITIILLAAYVRKSKMVEEST
jgi:hypothetical protein